MTAIELIDETVEFYGGDPDGRRAVAASDDTPTGIVCRYKLVGPGAEVRMCAVGRCMEDPPEELECAVDFLARKLNAERLDDLLKPEYRGLPLDLWLGLQQLHDSAPSWISTADGGGLTGYGLKRVSNLKAKHGLA